MENGQFTSILKNPKEHFSARLAQLVYAYHGKSVSYARQAQAADTLISPIRFAGIVAKEVPFNVHQVISIAQHIKLTPAQTHEVLQEHLASFGFHETSNCPVGIKKLMVYLGTSPKAVSNALGMHRDMDSWLNVPNARIPYIDYMAIMHIGLKVRVDPRIWKYLEPVVAGIDKSHKKSVKWGKEEGSYNVDKMLQEFDAVATHAMANPVTAVIKEARLGSACAKVLGITDAAFSGGLDRAGDKYIDASKFLKLREVLGYKLRKDQSEEQMHAALGLAMDQYRKIFAIDEQATTPALISAMGKMIGCSDSALGQIMGHSKVSGGVMMANYKADGFILDENRLGMAISFFTKAHDALKERYGVSCFSRKDIDKIDSLNEAALKDHLQSHPKSGHGAGPKPKLKIEQMKEVSEREIARL